MITCPLTLFKGNLESNEISTVLRFKRDCDTFTVNLSQTPKQNSDRTQADLWSVGGFVPEICPNPLANTSKHSAVILSAYVLAGV